MGSGFAYCGYCVMAGENQQWDDLDGCPDEIRCARHGHEFHRIGDVVKAPG